MEIHNGQYSIQKVQVRQTDPLCGCSPLRKAPPAQSRFIKDARTLKKQIETLDDSNRVEKLGLTATYIKIDEFFVKFSQYVEFHNAQSTAKRYGAFIRTFREFLKRFHPRIVTLAQVNKEIIDSYQMKRLESLELAETVNSSPFGHKKKLLPKPQTVNYEITVLRTAFLWAKEKRLDIRSADG